jgi:hypothetical protein
VALLTLSAWRQARWGLISQALNNF